MNPKTTITEHSTENEIQAVDASHVASFLEKPYMFSNSLLALLLPLTYLTHFMLYTFMFPMIMEPTMSDDHCSIPDKHVVFMQFR